MSPGGANGDKFTSSPPPPFVKRLYSCRVLSEVFTTAKNMTPAGRTGASNIE